MTIRQHDAEEAARASISQSMELRIRLLQELDELELALRGMRETVEQLPQHEHSAEDAPARAHSRKSWMLWKH